MKNVLFLLLSAKVKKVLFLLLSAKVRLTPEESLDLSLVTDIRCGIYRPGTPADR